MSSYSCVLPINWDCFWTGAIASWLDLLAGSISTREFYARCVPLGDDLIEDLCLDGAYRAPVEYLQFFADRQLRLWATSQIRATHAYAAFSDRADITCAASLLETTIKQTCGVELPGPDPFAKEPYGGYYSRLIERPHVQVAGTKNYFHFLNGLFTFDWHPSEHVYLTKPKGVATDLVRELLEALFLGVRALPGTWLAPQSPSWPAFDDVTFPGYLAPGEVRTLSDVVTDLTSVAAEADDELFPLIIDRVQRAADSGLGLITIHGGL